ncbi:MULTISPECIES: tape measure protein [unclassified Lactococcus]|nr:MULTISPECIES: tape measure protein [unclassified Lactococcus]
MSALKGEASQLRKDLKFDPSNVSKMTQLQKNYTQQLEQTKAKLSTLKKELSGVDKTTPDGQKKFIKLSKDIQDAQLKAGYLEKDIQSVDGAIKSGNFNVKLQTSDSESKLKSLRNNFSALREVAVGVFRQIGSNITNSIGNAFSGWISDTKATQKAMISLQNVMKFKGNEKDFTSLSKQMQTLATDTNANTEDTLKLASTFIGLGNNAETASAKVSNIVKANQAFGGTSEDLTGVVQAYSQMSAAGKVTAENINQLTDNNTALGSALKSTVMEMNPALAKYGSFAGASEKGAISVDMLDKALAKMGQSSGGGVETIDDAMASLNETISIALLPSLDKITPLVTKIINQVASNLPKILDNITKVTDFIVKNADAIIALVAAVVAVVAAFKTFSIVMSALTAITAVFGVTFGVAFAWLIAIIAIIAAVVAVGVLLYKNWDKVTAFAISAWGNVKKFFAGLGTWFGQLWDNIVKSCTDAWTAIVDSVSGVVENIKSFFSGIGTWFGELWASIVEMFTNAWTSVTETVQNVVNSIVTFFQPLTDLIKAIIDLVVAVFDLGWQLILAGARLVWQGMTALWNGLVAFFTPIWEAVKNVVNSVFAAVGQFASNAWNKIVSIWNIVASWFSGIFNAVKDVISSVFSTFGGYASNAWSAISSVFNSVGQFFSGIFNGVKTTISNVFSAVGGFARSGYDAITRVFNGIGDFFSRIFNGVKQTIDNVLGGVSSTISGITDKIKGVTDKVKGLFGGSIIVSGPSFNPNVIRGLERNSVSSVSNSNQNIFNINGGNQSALSIAREVTRLQALGRA